MKHEPEDWKRVYQAIDERRLALGWSKTRLYVETVSEGTLEPMRRSGQPIKRQDKMRLLTSGLGWSDDSVERILRGDLPLDRDEELRMAVEDEATAARQVDAARTQLDDASNEADRVVARQALHQATVALERATRAVGMANRARNLWRVRLDRGSASPEDRITKLEHRLERLADEVTDKIGEIESRLDELGG